MWHCHERIVTRLSTTNNGRIAHYWWQRPCKQTQHRAASCVIHGVPRSCNRFNTNQVKKTVMTFATQCSCDEDEFRIYWIWWVGIIESLKMLCQMFESTQTNNTQHPHFWLYSGYSSYLILKILARRSRHGRQEGSRCRSGCGHEPKSQGEKTDERFQVAWPKHFGLRNASYMALPMKN